MWAILKKIFFLFDAEKAHYFSMHLFSFALHTPLLSYFVRRSFRIKNLQLALMVDGVMYPNPIGLAAGFDKDGQWLGLLQELGFGFVEVGTVTPKPQAGNEKPRLFRLISDQAIINRMGFNNSGADALALRLKEFRKNGNSLIIGGNIGKNKATPPESAADDYLYCFRTLCEYVDYFVVNVSSPNTPGLRALQEKEPLTKILSALQRENELQAHPKPIYLKIAPDLSNEMIHEIIEVVVRTGISGLVATNTTIRRPESLTSSVLTGESGGLSGAPLTGPSMEVLRTIRSEYQGTIISVGGIMSPFEAKKRLQEGANLIQLYSGLIYEGPWLVRRILKAINTAV